MKQAKQVEVEKTAAARKNAAKEAAQRAIVKKTQEAAQKEVQLEECAKTERCAALRLALAKCIWESVIATLGLEAGKHVKLRGVSVGAVSAWYKAHGPMLLEPAVRRSVIVALQRHISLDQQQKELLDSLSHMNHNSGGISANDIFEILTTKGETRLLIGTRQAGRTVHKSRFAKAYSVKCGGF